MKLVKTTLATLSIAALASSASATMNYSFLFPQSAPIAKLDPSPGSGEVTSFSGLFKDLALDLTHSYISSASMIFFFADDGDGSTEFVDIFIGDLMTKYYEGADNGDKDDPTEIDGNHSNANPVVGNTSYDYRTFDLDSAEIDDLKDDKEISFKVDASKGDTYLKAVRLNVTTKKRPTTTIPDAGATSLMLGLAFLGLAAARKRFAK